MADPGTKQPTRMRGVVLLGVVLLLGLICGAALFHIGQHSIHMLPHRPAQHDGRGHPFRHMARELDLDEEQAKQVREILRRSRSEVHALLEQTHAEIRELLRPEQRERLDELHAERPGMGHLEPGKHPHGRRPPPPPAE